MRVVQATLAQDAPGRERCMYCHDSEGCSIDHYRPRSRFPDLTFAWTNLLWACAICNSNLKRDVFPQSSNGQPLLLDPVQDTPEQHLAIDGTLGMFVALTPRGQASIDVFRLNRQTLCTLRVNSVNALNYLMTAYLEHRTSNQDRRADECLAILRTLEPDYMRLYCLIPGALAGIENTLLQAVQNDASLRAALAST